MYRLDRKARHIELLLTHAQKATDIKSCTGVYEWIRADRSCASESPQIQA